MGGQDLPPRHTAGAPDERQPGPMGRRVHLPLHPDQRLHLNKPIDCGILQPQRWQETHLRRHEQRIRVGKALSTEHLHAQQIISEPFRVY